MIGQKAREMKRGTLNGTTVRHFETPSGAHATEVKIEVDSELAAHNLKCLCKMIDSVRGIRNTEELNDMVMTIGGYVTCCVNSNFISEQAAEELLGMAAMIAQAQEDRIKGNVEHRSVAFTAYEQREGLNNGGKKVMRQEK
jgi:hypothetical protein